MSVGILSLSLFPTSPSSSPEKGPVGVFPQFPLPLSLLFIHLPLSLSPLHGFSLLLITITSSLPTCLSLPSPTSCPLLLSLLSSGSEPVLLARSLSRDWDKPQLGLPGGWTVRSPDLSLLPGTRPLSVPDSSKPRGLALDTRALAQSSPDTRTKSPGPQQKGDHSVPSGSHRMGWG